MEITIPYYEDNSRVSNSALGWFINNGPAYFHAKLSGEVEEETTSAMTRGTMIHMYLLQPDEFQKTYKVWTGTKPSSDKQELFCKALVESVEIEPDKAALSAFKAVYSTVNQSEDKMLSKAREMANMLHDYIVYLRNPEYELISLWDAKKLNKIKENIDAHKLAPKLLNPTSGETHHEFHINWECHGVPCKSLLDSVHFDFEKKICTLMDLKTTVKIGHFEDSVNQYDYTRQLEFYTMALIWYLENERNEDPSLWHFDWYIIAIDTTGSNEIRVFKFKDDQVLPKSVPILNTIDEIKWHQDNGKWAHHREYYETNGFETLNL